jgi:PhzF family phenazine biosynthesis protein
MKIPFFHVDAFTKEVFRGNPAAICLLEAWPDEQTLLNIAAENNLSETAFLVPKSSGRYGLRWFTPALEMDLCGHATLASAFVLFAYYDRELTTLNFETASGLLTVEKSNDLLAMDFPARKAAPTKVPPILAEALGATPVEVFQSRDLMAVFETESVIANMAPDIDKIRRLDAFAVIVTGPGRQVDFVSRFFAPKAGAPEDPVTGSAHCTLIPYWAERLGKKELHARQLSRRGGELFCRHIGDRVRIAGHAVLFAKGEIHL